jgi:hypothetical protein
VRAQALQIEMDVEDPDAVRLAHERKIEERREQLALFFKLCREVCRLLSYEHVAAELEKEWGDLGRHVSAGVLKNTIAPDSKGNYFRWEWGMWFAEQNEEIADLLCEIAGRGKPKKDPKDELRDLQNIMRTHYPKDADRHIRKAATP